jgi:Fur family transcriptional regulator, peroxide stress response regulator
MQHASYEEALETLRSKGIRLTSQRQLILKYLKSTHKHPTAEDIHREISQTLSGISLATVYNTLNTLKEYGVIRELSYGDMASRYDGNETLHAHLVCEQCGDVYDIPSPSVEEIYPQAARESGFLVASYRLEYYGICKKCQAPA